MQNDWQLKLRAESHVCTQALRKLLWRVVRIIDIPLKLVSVDYSAYSHIEFDYADLLQIYRLELPTAHTCGHLSSHYFVPFEVLDLSLHLTYYVLLKAWPKITLID